ncbi:Lrp/AsnC family transcriptional regulator [Cognatishimia sp. SS12]|uniref:Lrp/AsnC family transcriptional regulator n=1 Tax=Cognatishimia sp. SS12 TaxID=2979465 RepID=UPI00232E9579|nr:Lrp/AsnC family transcriptional regulator [Cognatishimia sp. SS12]MDC0737341.1 Lrp/AsnC family transcriptional regulator [Cognatishimia sp. SS12]
MTKETDNVRQTGAKSRPVDAMDRKILGKLAEDATGSYAELAREVGLSAPAVHERVKRMRAAGVIKRTVAELDGPALGKNFLAFIHVESSGWGKTQEIIELADLPEVEEIHAVTGDTGLILKVRMENARAMEGFLWRLYDKTGVQSTRTYVALSTHVERGVQPTITAELSEGDHLK